LKYQGKIAKPIQPNTSQNSVDFPSAGIERAEVSAAGFLPHCPILSGVVCVPSTSRI
jgi:hypothetical protein